VGEVLVIQRSVVRNLCLDSVIGPGAASAVVMSFDAWKVLQSCSNSGALRSYAISSVRRRSCTRVMSPVILRDCSSILEPLVAMFVCWSRSSRPK